MGVRADHKSMWERLEGILGHWINQRKVLLSQYGELAIIKTFNPDNTLHGALVQEFCQSMVDYLSLVHFEVFEQVSQENVFSRAEYKQEAMDLMRGIQTTTDNLLDFNDKYLALDDLETLASDLSALGEELAQRFELEDQVIGLIRKSKEVEPQLIS
jgi:regulator of sigma D